jgi:hypothetical protein
VTNIDVESGNEVYSSVAGVLFNHDQTVLLQYPLGRVGPYELAASVTNIAPAAFTNSVGLTSFTAGMGLVALGNDAFNHCPRLTNVVLNDGLKDMADRVFNQCSNLVTVNFPNSLTNIGSRAFFSCTKIANVEFGEELLSIGNWAFSNDIGITNLILGRNLAQIGIGAFYNCGILRLAVPSSVKSIGSLAFTDCVGLKNILFLGDAPTLGNAPFSAKSGAPLKAAAYYLPSTSGWGDVFAGLAMKMGLPAPSIERVEGDIQLSWPFGVLLESTNVAAGAWTTNGISSPARIRLDSDVPQKFYRVVYY